jgi:hypothetical protein
VAVCTGHRSWPDKLRAPTFAAAVRAALDDHAHKLPYEVCACEPRAPRLAGTGAPPYVSGFACALTCVCVCVCVCVCRWKGDRAC